jgi:hypothetical protein
MTLDFQKKLVQPVSMMEQPGGFHRWKLKGINKEKKVRKDNKSVKKIRI